MMDYHTWYSDWTFTASPNAFTPLHLTVVPKTYVTSADRWELYRNIIGTLYDYISLRQLAVVMECKFNFVASQDMFKARLRDWNKTKYNNSSTMREKAAIALKRKSVGLDVAGHRDLERYWKRRRMSLADAVATHLKTVPPPDDHLHTERLYWDTNEFSGILINCIRKERQRKTRIIGLGDNLKLLDTSYRFAEEEKPGRELYKVCFGSGYRPSSSRLVRNDIAYCHDLILSLCWLLKIGPTEGHYSLMKDLQSDLLSQQRPSASKKTFLQIIFALLEADQSNIVYMADSIVKIVIHGLTQAFSAIDLYPTQVALTWLILTGDSFALEQFLCSLNRLTNDSDRRIQYVDILICGFTKLNNWDEVECLGKELGRVF